ncbi:MAG: hypothetical protein ACLFR1_10710 [Spirochaetia bacterium]
MLLGIGTALILLPSGEVLDYIVAAIINSQGFLWYDGFIFSCGYLLANLILLYGVMSSFSAETNLHSNSTQETPLLFQGSLRHSTNLLTERQRLQKNFFRGRVIEK